MSFIDIFSYPFPNGRRELFQSVEVPIPHLRRHLEAYVNELAERQIIEGVVPVVSEGADTHVAASGAVESRSSVPSVDGPSRPALLTLLTSSLAVPPLDA